MTPPGRSAHGEEKEHAMRAVVIDVDGTLSDPSGRLHHLDGEKDWKAFHDGMGDDEPIEAVATLARILYAAAERGDGVDAVMIVTARHDDPVYRQLTVDWLDLHGIRYHALYMRRDTDTRRDHLVKADILAQMREDGYEPMLAIDDRPEVVRMWRAAGIVTLQCAPDEPGASIYAGADLLHMLVGPWAPARAPMRPGRIPPTRSCRPTRCACRCTATCAIRPRRSRACGATPTA